MKFTEHSLNILTALSFKNIGKAWVVKNIKGNESDDIIVSMINDSIKENKITVDKFKDQKKNLKSIIYSKLNNYCDGIIAYGDPDFPLHRGNVKNSEKPVLLFYKGNISLLDKSNLNVSVIGVLNPDSTIQERECKIVDKLVKSGATIVSGLAFGCDSIAHKQALDSNGKTIAILPSPLYDILPSKNANLAYQIVEEGGLLVTEYYNKHESLNDLKRRYAERDRLQALFADLVLLVASYSEFSAQRHNLFHQKLDSGARIAMNYAKNYHIKRAVMFDEKLDKDNPMFDLNQDLIKADNNIFVIDTSDIDKQIRGLIQVANNKIIVQKTLF